MDLEQVVTNTLNVLGFFFASQPWFVAVRGITVAAITTIEIGANTGKIDKDKKKAAAIEQIDKACKELGVYKSINRGIIMSLAGPAIDTIIWVLNTFFPGWNDALKQMQESTK
jgi:hypothetical protein